MVYQREKQIDDAFFALSHPVRRAMLEKLSDGSTSVADISAPFSLSPAQSTKHIAILERGGLITREKQGRTHQLTIKTDVLFEIEQWIQRYQQFWDSRLDALDSFLAKTNTATQPEDDS